MNFFPLRRKSSRTANRQSQPLSLPTMRLPAANGDRTQQILWTPPTNPRLIVTASQTKTPPNRRDWAFLAGGMAGLALCLSLLQHWSASHSARIPNTEHRPPTLSVVRVTAPSAPALLVTAPALPVRPIRPTSFAPTVGPFVVSPGVPIGEP